MSTRHLERVTSTSLLVKLGSIARHAQEATGAAGHPADLLAIRSLLADPEVVAWLAELDALGLLPVRR